MEKQEEAVLEIDESPVVEEQSADFDITGLTDGEVTLAKEQGLYIEKEESDEHDEQSEPETKDSKTEEDKKAEEVSDELPKFEDAENDEKLIEKYNRNEKALYFKWKADKQKRQDAQTRAKELEDKLAEALEGGASSKKINKIKELLANPDSLTIEALQEAIDMQVEAPAKENELDNAQVIQKKVALKAEFATNIGTAKYDNFEGISNLAKEIIQADKSGTYQKLVDDSFLNDDVDENMLVERIVSIARMNPRFNEVSNQVRPEEKAVQDRVLNNSKKKVSSASVSGASGKRIISEAELTVDQAAKLTAQQWGNLKESTRNRILMGKNP